MRCALSFLRICYGGQHKVARSPVAILCNLRPLFVNNTRASKTKHLYQLGTLRTNSYVVFGSISWYVFCCNTLPALQRTHVELVWPFILLFFLILLFLQNSTPLSERIDTDHFFCWIYDTLYGKAGIRSLLSSSCTHYLHNGLHWWWFLLLNVSCDVTVRK